MLGIGLGTGSLALLLAVAGVAQAQGQDEERDRGERGERDAPPEKGEDPQASAVDGIAIAEPEPGSACRPQC